MDEMNILKIAWVFQFLSNIADVDVKTMTQERKMRNPVGIDYEFVTWMSEGRRQSA